jgi:hypothetical protein
MLVSVNMFSRGTPKRGDILQTNVGDRRERTFLILSVRRMRSTIGVIPRFKVWAERWWEIEPELRMRLFLSAERAGGQQYIYFTRDPPKPGKRKGFSPHHEPERKHQKMASPILKYFAFAHLPRDLQGVSGDVYALAHSMEVQLPDGPEKSAGLRKLLEAKDCFVRAKLG